MGTPPSTTTRAMPLEPPSSVASQPVSGDDSWPLDDAGGESDADDGEHLLGWIDPADRLWRHPSEVGPGSGRPAVTSEFHNLDPVAAGVLVDGHLGRRGAATWLICGSVCIALAVAAVAVVVADTGENATTAPTATPWSRSAPTTEPGSAGVGAARLGAAVAGVRPSMVALHVVGVGSPSTAIGIVVEAGGIVVTTARAVSGAQRITAVEPDGARQAAQLIGIDPTSDLAVVRIDDDLPAATFATDDLSTGSMAMAMAMAPRRSSDPVSLVYAGTVVSSGNAVFGDGATATFAATTVRTPLDRSDLGCPLVDRNGEVMGMLELTAGSAPDRLAVFLPGALVAGVARQLVSAGGVEHGWLGVGEAGQSATLSTLAASGSTEGQGAQLGSVVHGSPAALAGLAPGDTIVAVDGAPVHSMAELMTRLYPDPPGTPVTVTFLHAQVRETVEVELANPAAGSNVTSSP